MNKQLVATFKNPGSAYRGKPFWAWNGKLDPQELRRQIRVMQRMGLGGFFMHARVGLDTAYLSRDWFACVDACIAEAEKLDMEAWLYDEDRWPSGAAGGLVTKDPKYRMRHLVLRNISDPRKFKWQKCTVAAFVYRLAESTVHDVRRLAQGERPTALAAGEVIGAFSIEIEGNSDWYNGQAYLDTLNPAAVKRFIRITYEAYLKNIGQHFGKRVPGIFTDEPNHGAMLQLSQEERTNTVRMPWTDRLPALFRERYGYDLPAHLPEIVYDLEGQAVSRARYHYHECVTFMFVDAFARQIGAWCAKHNILFTGHVLAEETLSSQTTVVGSAMRSYEFMQAPGMDLLTEHNREYDTAKQVSSVAHQFGWKWRLTETYGCTGWDFPFAGHKALSDWQVALGINLRCQHLSWYTMAAEAKRDYPAGIFFHSPWWELYPKVEDYFARIHAVMTRGTEVRDLLVIHPIESMWLLCRHGWKDHPGAVKALDSMLVELRDSLLVEHLDFDYGEEDILARHGRVVNGSKPELVVAKARYKAVLVPPLLTLRSSTLRLLDAFRKAGGLVVFAGDVPAYVDAVASDAARTLAAECRSAPAKGPSLAASVAMSRRISVADATGKEIRPALYLLREDNEAFYCFICNTSLDDNQRQPAIRRDSMVRDRRIAFSDVTVRGFAGCKGHPVELDPDTGEMYQAEAERRNREWIIKTNLPALGSRLFVVSKKAGQPLPKRRALSTIKEERLDQTSWPIRLSECNNLVLDRPCYTIGNRARRGPEEILRVDKAVRTALGIKPRCGGMKQPWVRAKPTNPKSVPITLTYTFDAEAAPSGDLHLALERPEIFRIRLNGAEINTDAECGWWVDRSLRKLPLDPALIRSGRNEITLAGDYDENFSGLEIMYLLGNFGTRVAGTHLTLTAPATALTLGDWVEQGLTFYSGSVRYGATLTPVLAAGERLFAQIPDYRGIGVRIIVNGKTAGVIAWEPNEIDVTDFLVAGANELWIEVIGHRRNSHGPHHLKEKWPRWTGPSEYQAPDDQWLDGYNLVPCGLMSAPKLVFRRQV